VDKSRLPPIHTNHLFRPLARKLIKLLRSLPDESWDMQTCYPRWTVHDIAGHLLRTGIGRLSSQRDGRSRKPGQSGRLSYEAVSALVDERNEQWASLMSSVSPRLLVDMLGISELQLAEFYATLTTEGEAPIPVAWAGEDRSPIWFDTAREFAERWHHQQQIRDAVGASGIAEARFLEPILATLMRALPFWYHEAPAPEGTTIRFMVDGESGGVWELERQANGWQLSADRSAGDAAATVTMTEDTAWRFLTRTVRASTAEPLIEFSGDPDLARRFLKVVAVMMPEDLR
jgi:hypothetical protein